MKLDGKSVEELESIRSGLETEMQVIMEERAAAEAPLKARASKVQQQLDEVQGALTAAALVASLSETEKAALAAALGG